MTCARAVVLLASLLCPITALAQGASWRLLFDSSNAALNKGAGYKTYSNASGTLAWGESYIMMSYAAMYRATAEPFYLQTLADHALHVLDQRDNKKGLKDYAGKSRPCWQASKYSSNGKGYCWVVHSGMLTYPMVDLVLLVNQDASLKFLPVPNSKLTLGQAAALILAEVKKVVASHDFQYKSGPGKFEGYYQGDPAATSTVPSVAGKALPLNQMNAMGRTRVLLWKATGSTVDKLEAQQMVQYLKNRMKLKGSTYVWTYWGTAWSQGGGEDVSHAAINADFAWLAHKYGLVFSSSDMVHLAKTLIYNVHRSTDQAADRVDGAGTSNTYRWAVGRWLNLSPYDARVWPVAANIFRGVTKAGSGQNFLGVANLCRYAPPVWHHTFYHVDWQDLGAHRKALKFGANILTLPPDPTKPLVLKLGYRAAVAASIDQWEGKAKKYHLAHRLAATGSAWQTVFTPFWPGIYYPYTSKNEVLFQFTDTFVAGKGIEVKEVNPVQPPSITNMWPPVAYVGKKLSYPMAGAGDKPLVWSVTPPLGDLKIGLQSGVITWTPTPMHAPKRTITVRLRNDSGEAKKTITIMVLNLVSDAGTVAPDKGIKPPDKGPPPNNDGLVPKPDLPVAKPDAPGVKPDLPGVKPDALPPQADGNAKAHDLSGGQVTERGGCQCRSEGKSSDGMWALLVVLGLLMGGRTRNRQKTSSR